MRNSVILGIDAISHINSYFDIRDTNKLSKTCIGKTNYYLKAMTVQFEHLWFGLSMRTVMLEANVVEEKIPYDKVFKTIKDSLC